MQAVGNKGALSQSVAKYCIIGVIANNANWRKITLIVPFALFIN